jgi:hypothetical protein
MGDSEKLVSLLDRAKTAFQTEGRYATDSKISASQKHPPWLRPF